VEAIQDPDRFGDGYVRRMAGSIIPTIVAHIAQTQDPVMRDARTITDHLKSRIPGLSQTLPPRRNIFGEAITFSGSLGPDIASSIYTSTEKDNPVARAMMEADFYPKMPRREVNGHDLTPEQFSKFAEMMGKRAVEELTPIVTRPSWKNLDQDNKERRIRKAYDDAREYARRQMKREYPELRRKVGE
jgi:hypothetical protein